MPARRSALRMLAAARSAARSYVRALPPDEPVMLATFDERLMLHASPSTDRIAFETKSNAELAAPPASFHPSNARISDEFRSTG